MVLLTLAITAFGNPAVLVILLLERSGFDPSETASTGLLSALLNLELSSALSFSR